MTLLNRIGRLTWREVRWRASTALRTRAQYGRTRLSAPRWDRRDIVRALSGHVADPTLRAAAAAERWGDVHQLLLARIRSRSAQFVLDPASRDALRAAVLRTSPTAASDAALRADRLLTGEHDLLGYRRLSFSSREDVTANRGSTGRRPDWHLDPVHNRRAPAVFHTRVPYLDPSIGDHKIIWELNRHQHWLQFGRAAWLTGDGRYAQAIIDDLTSWLDANPPLIGINWASMLELGFRSLSWTWALHALLATPAAEPRTAATSWLVDMLVALARQLTHIEQNLSYYFSPNTHLTGEALALYVVGTALPELAGAPRWASLGRRVLLDEAGRQVLPDGGHAERSTHYQRYTLDFYLLALLTATRAGDTEAQARFRDVVRRLAEFTRVIADDKGRLPLIGDDDGGMLWPLTGRACDDVRDSLAVAALVLEQPWLAPWGAAEEALWIVGPDAAAPPPVSPPNGVGSRLFADTGYLVARGSDGSHAVFDVGAHGYMNGGHAHADALSLTLSMAGVPLLVDTGTSTYTVNTALRERMRRSMNHNTLTISGRSQSVAAGPFHWRTHTDARLAASRHNDDFDWAEAYHDGYAPFRHRRSVVRTAEDGWLVVDEVLGDRHAAAAVHWHFDPAWTVRGTDGAIGATHLDGGKAWLLHDGGRCELFLGDEDTGLGWHAPAYGTLLPTWTARVSAEGEVPLVFVTWIGSSAAGEPQPSLTRAAITGERGPQPVAAQVLRGNRHSLFVLRPGGASAGSLVGATHSYQTDARVLHAASLADRLLSVSLVDASRFDVAGGLALESDQRIADLHIALRDGTVDMRTSCPPATIRLYRANHFHTVRLNGRPLPLVDPERSAGVVIDGPQWHGGTDVTAPTRPWLTSGAAFADQ